MSPEDKIRQIINRIFPDRTKSLVSQTKAEITLGGIKSIDYNKLNELLVALGAGNIIVGFNDGDIVLRVMDINFKEERHQDEWRGRKALQTKFSLRTGK